MPAEITGRLQGRSRAYGVELMLARKKGELTGWLNYTYARTQNQVAEGADFRQRINGGEWYRANYDRPHSLNASLNLNQGKNHAFAFNFAYGTGRPYTAPEGFIRYGGRTYPLTLIAEGSARTPTGARLRSLYQLLVSSVRTPTGAGLHL